MKNRYPPDSGLWDWSAAVTRRVTRLSDPQLLIRFALPVTLLCGPLSAVLAAGLFSHTQDV